MQRPGDHLPRHMLVPTLGLQLFPVVPTVWHWSSGQASSPGYPIRGLTLTSWPHWTPGWSCPDLAGQQGQQWAQSPALVRFFGIAHLPSLRHSTYQAKKRHLSSRSTDEGTPSTAVLYLSLSWGPWNTVNWDNDRALASFQDGQAPWSVSVHGWSLPLLWRWSQWHFCTEKTLKKY